MVVHGNRWCRVRLAVDPAWDIDVRGCTLIGVFLAAYFALPVSQGHGYDADVRVLALLFAILALLTLMAIEQ